MQVADLTLEQREAARLDARLEQCRRHLMPFIEHTFPGYRRFPAFQLVTTELEVFEQQVIEGLSPRLIINMPPRTGKSEVVSRRYPPWILGRHPDWNVGVVSYGAELAEELSADARRCIMSDEYAQVFGPQSGEPEIVELDRSSKAVGYWRINNRRGGLRAVGVGGALTGRGFDIGIIDDPIKGRKEADSHALQEELWTFYKGTYYTRIEPGGGIIIMNTRWTTIDLTGRLLSEMAANEDVDRWRIITVTGQYDGIGDDPLGRRVGEFMECRTTQAQWERLRNNMPPREWESQFMQRPSPPEGQIFRPYEIFTFADPPKTEFGDDYSGPRFAFTDTSYAKNREGDFSGLGVWQLEPPAICKDGVRRPTLGLLDVLRGRYQFPELKQLAKNTYAKYRLWALAIEDYGSGVSLVQEFKRASGMQIIAWRPDRDKVARAYAATDVMATYRIRLPATDHFPSGLPVRVYLDELASFPHGDYDDLVDITSMAMILIGVRDLEHRRTLRTFEFAWAE